MTARNAIGPVFRAHPATPLTTHTAPGGSRPGPRTGEPIPRMRGTVNTSQPDPAGQGRPAVSQPALDTAYYEELHGRLLGLLILVQDRLADQAGYVHDVIDVGEYGLALEDIVGILAWDQAPVTDQERDDIAALSQTMGMDDLIGDKLRSCPRPGQAR